MSDTKAPDAPRAPDIGRRTLTPFGYAVCIVVPVLIAAIGFTFLHFSYDEDDLVDGTRVPILTSDWEPGVPSMTALITGELVFDDGCVVLTAPDGTEAVLVWPADFEATIQRVGKSDQLKVYDSDRNIVARGGDQIEFGGGSVPVGEYAGRPCAPDSGDVAVVQSEVTVVRGS